MKQSHLERLAQGLPADMQASFLEATKGYSSDGNDPIEAFFSALSEARRRDTLTILEKLATDETWKSQLREQLTKDHTENTKTIRQEISALSGKTLWKRIITTRIVGAVIWLAVVASLTPYVVKKQVGTVDPVFHERVSTAESEIKKRIDDQAQLTNLRNDQLMDLVRENTDTLKKTHVTTAAETMIGKGIFRYVSGVTEKTMTVEVDGRKITVPHYLSTQDHAQLELALMAIKKAE